MTAFCPICGGTLDTGYQCLNVWTHPFTIEKIPFPPTTFFYEIRKRRAEEIRQEQLRDRELDGL